MHVALITGAGKTASRVDKRTSFPDMSVTALLTDPYLSQCGGASIAKQ
jgi:hypothetical protein